MLLFIFIGFVFIDVTADVVYRIADKIESNFPSYGIFLGYTIGLDPNQYSIAEFPEIVEEKMQEDIRRNIDYILQKISDNNLNLHSFYFYVLPFNDGETDKKDIMEAVLKGDVDL